MARVRISDTKAYSVEGIHIDGVDYVSIRQLYATRKEPGVFKPGRQGVTLPLAELNRIMRAVKHVSDQDPETFQVIEKE